MNECCVAGGVEDIQELLQWYVQERKAVVVSVIELARSAASPPPNSEPDETRAERERHRNAAHRFVTDNLNDLLSKYRMICS